MSSRTLQTARIAAHQSARATTAAALPSKGKGKFGRAHDSQPSEGAASASTLRPRSFSSAAGTSWSAASSTPLITPRRPLPREARAREERRDPGVAQEGLEKEIQAEPIESVDADESQLASTSSEPLPPPSHLPTGFLTRETLSTQYLSLLESLTSPPPTSALSAFAHRLSSSVPSLAISLSSDPALLERTLIHDSFWAAVSSLPPSDPSSDVPRAFTHHNDPSQSHNGPLATLGNAILGTLTSEALFLHFPHLPTRVTKAAVTLYVGPKSLAGVATSWGVVPSRLDEKLVGKEEEGKMKSKERAYGHLVGGVGGARKPKGGELDGAGGAGLVRWNRRKTTPTKDAVIREDALASVTRAVVGLVYQLHGFAVARAFAHAHILARLVSPSNAVAPPPAASADIVPLFHFDSPSRVLSQTVSKFGLERPIHRLLKESGRLSNHPTFLSGVYAGEQKLGEGFGSSIKMSEWRASEDALRRLYLSGSRAKSAGLPSDVWCGKEFKGVPLGDVEVAEESAARR